MCRHRSGLTLIETLVVVMIIGVLIALLLPAVQSSREAARKTVCQNNLRQVSEAVLLHEAANQALPSLYNGSFLPQPRSAVDEFNFHSWRTAILPQLEQSSVFASLNITLPTTTVENQTGLNVSLAVFLCPSTSNTNPMVRVLEWNDGKIPVKIIGTAARSDYEVIGGVHLLAQQPGTSLEMRGVRFGAWGEPSYNTATGVSLRYRKARLADVTDGLSNTLLVGERAGRPDYYRRGEQPDPYPYRDPATHGQGDGQAAWAVSTHFLWTLYYFKQSVNDTNSRSLETMRARLERDDRRAELLKRFLSAQEGERMRIARELHDETCQTISALSFRLESALGDLPAGEARTRLEEVQGLAGRALDDLHRVIFDLRPSVLDDLGLLAAVRWYAARHLEPLGILVKCEFEDVEGRVPQDVATAVFRIVQEALLNVARHAGAEDVLVQIAAGEKTLLIEIEDDGRGFDPKSVVAPSETGRGLGLLGMRERVEILGGKMSLDSAPGDGTHVAFEIPIPPEAAGA